MKGIVKFLVVILICFCVFAVGGCSFFGDNSNNNNDNNGGSTNGGNSGGSNSGNSGIRPEDINFEYVYKSDISYEEDPHTSLYNIYEDPSGCYFPLNQYKSEYFYKVAKSNPEIEFHLTAFAEIYGANAEFGVGVAKNTGKSGILRKKTFNCSKRYTSVNVSMTIKGRVLVADDMKVLVSFFCVDFGHKIYYKNLYFEIEIIP